MVTRPTTVPSLITTTNYNNGTASASASSPIKTSILLTTMRLTTTKHRNTLTFVPSVIFSSVKNSFLSITTGPTDTTAMAYLSLQVSPLGLMLAIIAPSVFFIALALFCFASSVVALTYTHLAAFLCVLVYSYWN